MSNADWLLLNRKKSEDQDRAMFGVADLHTHPAAHLGFGASNDGTGGLFWGKPGHAHTDANLSQDLPPCSPDKHSGFTMDVVEDEMRTAIMSELHKKTDWAHTADGWPTFSTWPAARSPSHQQMHITWIHRAWRAGLRLMVASAVDNQVLSMMWHRYALAPAPSVDSSFDYNSAKKQLDFIRDLVDANPKWMKIVLTSADAVQAIQENLLAVVLGVEMDQLTITDILNLVRDEGVRFVTPVHLVNNSFGGSAVYDEMFNTANEYLTQEYFDVVEDVGVNFRFNPVPEYLRWVSGNIFDGGDMIGHGAMAPTDASSVIYNYGVSGHRNKKGLDFDNLRKLMAEGLLIDVAHMSEICMGEAIGLAEQYEYPLFNSHTGIRPVSDEEKERGGPATSERVLRRDHAVRLTRLGGMIGLGTAYNGQRDPIERWFNEYKDLLSLTGGWPVALGSDANGLSMQLANSEVDYGYPFSIPNENLGFDQCPESFEALVLGLGTDSDFQAEGLAHYGMLPEFLHALATLDRNGPSVQKIFSSAQATVSTWGRVEQAHSRMQHMPR